MSYHTSFWTLCMDLVFKNIPFWFWLPHSHRDRVSLFPRFEPWDEGYMIEVLRRGLRCWLHSKEQLINYLQIQYIIKLKVHHLLWKQFYYFTLSLLNYYFSLLKMKYWVHIFYLLMSSLSTFLLIIIFYHFRQPTTLEGIAKALLIH